MLIHVFALVLVFLVALADETCKIPTIDLANGVEMPQLMLGSAHLREPGNIPSNPKFTGLVPDLTYQSVHSALKAGWRGIDSALIYRSHRAIAQVLGHWLMEGKLRREDVFLATKVFHGPVPGVATTGTFMDLDRMTPEETAQLTEEQLHASLHQIGVGYLDMVFMHWPAAMDSQDDGNRARRIAAWKILEEFYERGWARAIGVSNFSEEHLQQLVEDGAKVTPMVNQIEASVYQQYDKIVEYCKKADIIVQAYSPLGRGVTNALKDPVVLEIAKKHGKDAGQVAMRYLIQKGYVMTCLSTSPERLMTNQDIFYFELDKDDMGKLNALNRPDGTWGLPSPYGMT